MYIKNGGEEKVLQSGWNGLMGDIHVCVCVLH